MKWECLDGEILVEPGITPTHKPKHQIGAKYKYYNRNSQ